VVHEFLQEGIGVVREARVDTNMRGRTLLLVRALWFIAAAVALGLYAFSIPLQAQMMRAPCTDNCQFGQITAEQMRELTKLGLSLNFYVAYNIVLNMVFFLLFVAVAALISWRKADDWFGTYVALTLVLFGISFGNPLPLLAKYHTALSLPLLALAATGGTLIGIFMYLFPDGRFVPRWTRWLIPLVIAREFAYVFFPDSPILMAFPLEFGSFVFAQIYRYVRSSSAVERQQTKWFVYGATVGILGFLGLILGVNLSSPNGQFPSAISELIGTTAVYSFLVLIPLSVMMAILRSHLWDIDIIIRRTLVYGALTALLALFYFGTVLVLQEILRAVTGQTSDLAIIASTLAIAALFNPLRRRIQQVIDRHFYRRKYDAQQVLAHFATTAHDQVEIAKLTEELLSVVSETMQPARVSLWLRDSSSPLQWSRGKGEARGAK
jgi:hypothetical protein